MTKDDQALATRALDADSPGAAQQLLRLSRRNAGQRDRRAVAPTPLRRLVRGRR